MKESTVKPLVDLFKKPTITEVSIVYEHGDRMENTLLFGLEKSTSRLYVFQWHISNEGTSSEVGDWMPGRFLTFEGNSWVSRHTSPPVKFETYEEIANYWNRNMVLHPGPSRGSQEWIDSMMNNALPEGMSLKHAGLYTMADVNRLPIHPEL